MKYDPSYNRAIWPESPGSTQDGMTLRDYFAAKAMQAMLSRDLAPAVTGNRLLKWAEVRVDDPYYPSVASKAYQVADAMLEVREAK